MSASGNFTNDGTIEAIATLVLDNDALTNTGGAGDGTVLVEAAASST